MLALAALAGAAGLALYQRTLHRRREAVAPGPDRSAALEQELAVLKARLRALEQQRRRPASEDPDLPGPAAAAATRPAGEEPAPAARPRPASDEDVRRYFAALEARLDGEERDGSWAVGVEEKLRQTGDGFGDRLTVEAARCGRALCRMDVKRVPGPEGASLMHELLRRAAGVLPEAVVANTADPSRVAVYLVRQGDSLPPLVGSEPAP